MVVVVYGKNEYALVQQGIVVKLLWVSVKLMS